jgi:hypothetical protein
VVEPSQQLLVHWVSSLQRTLQDDAQVLPAPAQLVRLEPLRHCFEQLCVAPQLPEQLWHLRELVE